MANTVVIEWEAMDGYAGGSRPHETEIDIEDMAEACETDEQAREYIAQVIQDDFDQTVHPGWDEQSESAAINAWAQSRQSR